MAEQRPITDIVHGVPPVTVSTTSTLINKTGSWKYIRPMYQDKVAPCNHGCPVGVDIEGYMNLIREGRMDEAMELLLNENPLPATTGRVCYHPCEVNCNRRLFDEPVSIHAVERMLGDRALESPRPTPPAHKRPETIGVVGSGPAGLACAYHMARLGYKVTIYEADPEPGGILRYGIPEYRLPKDVLAREIDRIQGHGVEIRSGTRVGIDTPWSELERHAAVFIATGVHKSKSLGPEFEEVAGIRPGLDFLREVNRGGRPDLGRKVVVVGGGNTAIDCARTALRLGAEVTILYRRSREEMPANPEEVEEALREGVTIEFLAAPVKPASEEHSPADDPLEAIRAMYGGMDEVGVIRRLTGMECQRMELGPPDDSGRRRPVPIEGSNYFLAADTVLTALGEDPDFNLLPDGIKRNASVVRVDSLGGTSRAAFFAGGDIIDEPHTVAYAIGSGKRAALGIDYFLRVGFGDTEGGAEIRAQRKGIAKARPEAAAGREGAEGGARAKARPEASPATAGGDGSGKPATPLGPGEEAEIRDLRWGEDGNVSMARWRGADPVRRASPANRVVEWGEMNPDHFRNQPRHADQHAPGHPVETGFAEVNEGLEAGEALDEAGRCLNCGVCNACELCLIYCPDVAISWRPDGQGFDINYEYCKGCGVCSAECPRGAITMTREGL